MTLKDRIRIRNTGLQESEGTHRLLNVQNMQMLCRTLINFGGEGGAGQMVTSLSRPIGTFLICTLFRSEECPVVPSLNGRLPFKRIEEIPPCMKTTFCSMLRKLAQYGLCKL